MWQRGLSVLAGTVLHRPRARPAEPGPANHGSVNRKARRLFRAAKFRGGWLQGNEVAGNPLETGSR